MAENTNPSLDEHVQVEFFSEKPMPKCSLPTFPFSLPFSSAKKELNLVLNSYIAASKEDGGGDVEEGKEFVFDFLIAGALLKTSLREALTDSERAKEAVIRVEVVLSQPTPTPDFDLPHDDWVGAVLGCSTFAVSGTYSNAVCVWQYGSMKPISCTQHSGPVKCLSSVGNSNDGETTIVSGSQDQSLILWKYKADSEELMAEFALKGHERSVECVCSNSDGSRIASGGFDSYLKIWDPSKSAEVEPDSVETADDKGKKRRTDKVPFMTPMVTLAGHKEAVTGVCWTKDPKEVATVSWDHSILLWDLELAGQKASMSGAKAFTSLSCCPSTDMIITGSVDKLVRLWDPRSKEGSMVKQAYSSHEAWVTGVTWHPLRDNLFVSGSYDTLVKMWDTRSPKAPLYDLSGHKDRILAVDWSDSARVLSGGADCSLKCFKSE